MRKLVEYTPVIQDVLTEYKALRTSKHNRSNAILSIREKYARELLDVEDCAAIMIGIANALCKKKELTVEIAQETRDAIHNLTSSLEKDDPRSLQMDRVEKLLDNPEMYGDEAEYRKSRQYLPDWQVGDTFAHTITDPCAEPLGVLGWSILLYKFSEYTNRQTGQISQLMYVALCEPGKEPACAEDIKKLGFLRTKRRTKTYLCQMRPTSKRNEKTFELRKIGCFPGIQPPEDCIEEDPHVCMPLFAYLSRDAVRPDYETDICHLIRDQNRDPKEFIIHNP